MAKKILFIEDETDQVMVIQARLEANGYDVVSAADGEEGLKKVYEEKPDLILLDLVIPKLDGFEVCKKIKADPQVSNIPVMIITAVGMKDLDRLCHEMHADDFVKKPYEATDFMQKVKKLIGS